MCLQMEEMQADQPQCNGEVAQFILTTYNIILRENFIYSFLCLFRETTFYLPLYPPFPKKETKSQYKHFSYNHVCKIYRPISWIVVLYGCETWSITLSGECRLSVFEIRCITHTVEHNYIRPSSTVGIQLHVSAPICGSSSGWDLT